MKRRVCGVNRDIYVASICKKPIKFAVRMGGGYMTSYYCPVHTREYAVGMIAQGEPFVVELAEPRGLAGSK